MKIKVNGLNRLQNKLKDLQAKASAIDGKNDVPLTELFPDGFMRRHTDFGTLQEMVDASGIEHVEEIGGDVWSVFVAQHSRFPGWDGLLEQATAEWVKRELGL